jgi:hypothetical protein
MRDDTPAEHEEEHYSLMTGSREQIEDLDHQSRICHLSKVFEQKVSPML